MNHQPSSAIINHHHHQPTTSPQSQVIRRCGSSWTAALSRSCSAPGIHDACSRWKFHPNRCNIWICLNLGKLQIWWRSSFSLMFEPFGGILHFQTPYQGNKLITIRVVNHRIHRENFKEKYITIKPNKYITIKPNKYIYIQIHINDHNKNFRTTSSHLWYVWWRFMVNDELKLHCGSQDSKPSTWATSQVGHRPFWNGEKLA